MTNDKMPTAEDYEAEHLARSYHGPRPGLGVSKKEAQQQLRRKWAEWYDEAPLSLFGDCVYPFFMQFCKDALKTYEPGFSWTGLSLNLRCDIGKRPQIVGSYFDDEEPPCLSVLVDDLVNTEIDIINTEPGDDYFFEKGERLAIAFEGYAHRLREAAEKSRKEYKPWG